MLYMIGLLPMASPQVFGPAPLDYHPRGYNPQIRGGPQELAFPYRPRRYSDVVFCFKKWRW